MAGSGERGRNRTYNLLIKSQLAPCHPRPATRDKPITYKSLARTEITSKRLKSWRRSATYSHNYSHTSGNRFLASRDAKRAVSGKCILRLFDHHVLDLNHDAECAGSTFHVDIATCAETLRSVPSLRVGFEFS